MSTEISIYKGKSFWIHNFVAEAWFAVLSKIVLQDTQVLWLQEYKKEIDDMLDCRWLTGLLQFDSDINTYEKEHLFKSLILEVNEYLQNRISENKGEDNFVIFIDNEEYVVAEKFLVPEMQRLSDLFFDPDAITANEYQCAGWNEWFHP